MRRAFGKKTVITALGIFLAATLIFIKVKVGIYQTSYEINENLKIKKELEEKNRRLKIETASLKSPSRIGMIAGGKLSLVPESGSKIIVVEKDESKVKR